MLRRSLRIIVVLALLAGGLVYAFRGPIALRLMRQALEHRLRADLGSAFPDGLHVVLCGAGGPLPDPIRSGPCAAVIAGGALYVVDAGSAAARNLQRLGLPPGQVAAVFLTHFHSDHIDGLGELALQRWAGGGHDVPLPVVGPAGVEDVVAGFNASYRHDAIYRVAHHGPEVVPPSGAGMRAQPFETPLPAAPVEVWNRDGLRVLAFRVDHHPVAPAVGYRFDYGGRSVVFSGDTRQSAEVARVARGADLLVHEALSRTLVETLHQAALAAGQRGVAKITADIPSYHTTPAEAAETAQAAGARHLLLHHIVPPLPAPGLASVFLEGVDDAFKGGVTLGRDGTTIRLPRDSELIEVSRR